MNEFVAEVPVDVRWKILDPRENLCALNDPCKGECRDWGLLELNCKASVNRYKEFKKNTCLVSLE